MDMNQKEMIMERKEVEFRPGKRYLHSFFLLDLEKIAIKRIQSASEMALGYYGKPLVVLTAEEKIVRCAGNLSEDPVCPMNSCIT